MCTEDSEVPVGDRGELDGPGLRGTAGDVERETEMEQGVPGPEEGHEGPCLTLWMVPLALWAWYWGRWDECLGQVVPGESPEYLERTAQWLVIHAAGILAAVVWAWAVITPR